MQFCELARRVKNAPEPENAKAGSEDDSGKPFRRRRDSRGYLL